MAQSVSAGGVGRPQRASPDWPESPAERVQQELDTVLGTGQGIRYQDRERLPYTRAVLHEVQRLSSVVAVGAVRQCVTSTRVHGHHVPKVGGSPVQPGTSHPRACTALGHSAALGHSNSHSIS